MGSRLGIAGPSSGRRWIDALRCSKDSAGRRNIREFSTSPSPCFIGRPLLSKSPDTHSSRKRTRRSSTPCLNTLRNLSTITPPPSPLSKYLPTLSFIPVITLSPDSPLLTLLDPISKLFLASPLPSYGLTIILFTLFIRTSLSVPIAYWQKRRMKRMMDVVVPQLRKFNAEEKMALMKKCKKEGVGYEVYIGRLKASMAVKAKSLHRLHSTNPSITTYAPLFLTIPTILFFSGAIRRAMAIEGSTMASEVFGIGELSFVLGEPSLGLALLGCGIGLINAEVFEKKMGDRKVGEEDMEAVKALREGKGVREGKGEIVGGAGRAGKVRDVALGGKAGGVVSGNAMGTENTRGVQVVVSAIPSIHQDGLPNSTSTIPPTPLTSARPTRHSSTKPTRAPPRPTKLPTAIRKFTTTQLTLFPTPTPPSLFPTPTTPNFLPTPTRSNLLTSPSRAPTTTTDIESVSLPNTQSAPPSSLREKIMLQAMRVMAVGFIFIGSDIASGVVLYWVSSLLFTLGQQTYLREVGKRNRKKAMEEIMAKAREEAP